MQVKKHINAVHDDHLENLVENIGYLKKIERGEIKCKFCRGKINLENINAIFPESGSIKFVCDNPTCTHELKTYLQENEFKQ
jgi:hypothetical protein